MSDKETTHAIAPRIARCCIAGGGPAGLMLGFLLARSGVGTIVLEKHANFLRDFRGDTIHPSTMENMKELGLLEEFLRLPHQKVERLFAQFGSERIVIADLSRLPVAAPFIAMMPQWDFLNFLTRKAQGYPGFSLVMRAEARDLIVEDGRIVGVRATSPEGDLEVRCDLVVAADGRQSTLRARSGLELEELGAPMDALWFRLPRQATDTKETQGRFDAGRIFIMLNRGDYWQCAFVIAKGTDAALRADGLDAFRASVGRLLPFDAGRAREIASFDDVKLLNVQVNRLKRWWKPGLLCIGDAAHAMSPVGGVGVNLAVQDAVAAANILAEPLRAGRVDDALLAAVQRRREWPTRLTQRIQLGMQNQIVAPAISGAGSPRPPALLRVLTAVPGFNRLLGRLFGLGIRREHVRTRGISQQSVP